MRILCAVLAAFATTAGMPGVAHATGQQSQVTYQVSGSAGMADYISYQTNSGQTGQTQLANVPLPWTTQYNFVAEIPGSDKAQEVVMLGGHLDSWHSATGATDNAIGASTMLEAIRILNAIGVHPRRTIRDTSALNSSTG